MTKSNKAAAIILGAAIGVALYRFFQMPRFERNEFIEHLKNRTLELLENTDTTVDRVDHFIGEIDRQGEEGWIGKLNVIKNMLQDLYGSEKRYLL